MRSGIFVLGLLCAVASPGAVFDFSTQSITSGLSTFTTSSGGVNLTISRESGALFDLVNLGGAGPSGWGNRVLSPFSDQGPNTGFIFNFSAPVSMFTLQLGDAGGDSDTWSIKAFSGLNGTGTLITSQTGTWGLKDFAFDAPQTVTISGGGILSVVFEGGSVSAPDSLFVSQIGASLAPAPEPASFGLMVLGLGAVGVAVRRRSAAGKA